MCVVGIDQSKRSTALVALNRAGNIHDLILITPGKDIDHEYLLQYQWNLIAEFLNNLPSIRAITIEALLLGSQSQGFDLLCGIHWHIRAQLLNNYPSIYGGSITVSTWRSRILPAKEAKEWKALYRGDKVGLKHGVLSKMPESDRLKMENYLDANKDRINSVRLPNWKPGSKSNEYRKGSHDIGDAWGIAKYRHSLFPAPVSLLRRK